MIRPPALATYAGAVLLLQLITVTGAANQKTTTRDDGSSLGQRNRTHIIETLHLDEAASATLTQELGSDVKLRKIQNIYKNAIKPMEDLYNFNVLNEHILTDAEIYAKPMVLFVGPWSVGKSTMINYLVGIENPKHFLYTGAQPTTSDFTVVMHGNKFRNMEGLVLAADRQHGFGALEKYGKGFLEKFQGVQMPYKILEKVIFVDTPGIIENRKQQERGYPFNDVMRWFIERSDLIFVVFDPTKLDVGTELETLFTQLKGRESQIRIIFNKADSLETQELMRVYGALFWSLAPLIKVTEPPRVYIGSFWDQPYGPRFQLLFQKEEISLLQDLYEMIENKLENKIVYIRHHALLVKIHALLVDSYLQAFKKHRSIFGYSDDALWTTIIENPHNYNIYLSVLSDGKVSRYDLPDSSVYMKFFAINAINSFRLLESHCSFFGGCPLNHLEQAIAVDLPQMLAETSNTCTASSCLKKSP